MGTIKSGTLEKQGGFMWKGWKRKHCVLYRDGEFAIYENATDSNAEFRINMRNDVKQIDIGFECGATNLPSSRSDIEALFGIVTGGKTYYMLAPSSYECREWVGVLGNARNTIQGSKVAMAPSPEVMQPPPYSPPMEYNQPLRGVPTGGVPPQGVPQQYQPPPPGMVPQPGYGQPPMYAQPGYGQPPMYSQPMYGQQPVYGQPMYGQPMYVTQSPRMQHQCQQQQQQQPKNNNTRNMMLAGGGGLLGGYLLGSAMSEGMHHHSTDYGGGGGGGHGGGGGGDGGGGMDSGFDHGAFDGGFDF